MNSEDRIFLNPEHVTFVSTLQRWKDGERTVFGFVLGMCEGGAKRDETICFSDVNKAKDAHKEAITRLNSYWHDTKPVEESTNA